MHRIPRAALFALCLTATMLAACTGIDDVGSNPSAGSQLAGLPRPSELGLRSISAAGDDVRRGIDTARRSAGAIEQNESLVLASTAGSIEWAVYQYQLTQSYEEKNMIFNLSGGGEAWIGLAEWDSDTWQMSGPFTTSQTLDLTSGGTYRNGLDRIYAMVVTFDGQSSTIDNVTLHSNTAPFPDFSANPMVGTPGSPSALDGSLSHDDDGTIVHYEWDLDGDQLYEVDGGTNPVYLTTLPDGAQDVRLRVTDDNGATGVKLIQLRGAALTPGQPVMLLPSDVSHVKSCEVINGNPAILFDRYGATMFIRAADPFGNSWTSPTMAYLNADTSSILAQINGKPAVAIKQPQGLLYISAKDTVGSQWNAPYVATPDGFSPRAFLDANGRPAIAAGGSNGLVYVHALDPDGQSWTDVQLLDDNNITQATVSMAIVNSRPAIGYVSSATGLSHLYALDLFGDTWNPATHIGGSSSISSFLTLINNKPAMFTAAAGGDLKFYHASNIAGTLWEAPVTVIANYTGKGNCFTMVNGNPEWLYYLTSPYRFMRCSATAADGSSWGAPYDFWTLTDVNGPEPHVCDASGKLGVAFMDLNGSDKALYFLRAP